jgi:ubiquinone/menaquinone biosynthesis C-methylase UbiE
VALQKRHIGGTALVTGYPWGKFNTIVDVAGGVGTFTADLLAAHPSLKGIVLDQSQQIERGKQVWAATAVLHELIHVHVHTVALC